MKKLSNYVDFVSKLALKNREKLIECVIGILKSEKPLLSKKVLLSENFCQYSYNFEFFKLLKQLARERKIYNMELFKLIYWVSQKKCTFVLGCHSIAKHRFLAGIKSWGCFSAFKCI